MSLALVLLSLAETFLNLALETRKNNAQTGEMTPEQEVVFDNRVKKIRMSAAADPNLNK